MVPQIFVASRDKAAMDSDHKTHRPKSDPPERRTGSSPTQAEDVLALEAVPLASPRPEAGPSPAERPGGILRLQRTVGNRVVLRVLEARVQPQATSSSAVGALTKTLGQEEELAKRTSSASPADVLTKTLGQEEELAKSHTRAPSATAQPVSEDRLRKAVIGEHGTGCGCALCESSPEVQWVAKPSNGRVAADEIGSAPTNGDQQD